jgi:hypothetical protein
MSRNPFLTHVLFEEDKKKKRKRKKEKKEKSEESQCWKCPPRSAMHAFTFLSCLMQPSKSSCVMGTGCQTRYCRFFDIGESGNVSLNSFWQVK